MEQGLVLHEESNRQIQPLALGGDSNNQVHSAFGYHLWICLVWLIGPIFPFQSFVALLYFLFYCSSFQKERQKNHNVIENWDGQVSLDKENISLTTI